MTASSPSLTRLADQEALRRSFAAVAAADGVPGVDGVSAAEFGDEAVDSRIAALASELLRGEWRPDPFLAVRVPKPGDRRGRELLIPTVRDRVVVRAVHDLLSPLIDAQAGVGVYGYRKGRSTQRAVGAVRSAVQARPFVLDADIRDFFGSVPFDVAAAAVGELIADQGLADVVDLAIRAPAVRGGTLEVRERGLPIGLALSPVMTNLVLRPLDEALTGEAVTYVRYADDFVVCCRSDDAARACQTLAREVLENLSLTLHPSKTRVVDARTESIVFLGHLVRADPDGRDAAIRAPARRTLHLVEPGSQVSCRRGRLVVEMSGAELLSVPVRAVGDIVVHAPTAFTSAALASCLEAGIDVAFVSGHGRIWGSLRTWRSPAPERRLDQLDFCRDPGRSLELGKVMIAAKVGNQKRLLQRQKARRPHEGIGEALERMSDAERSLSVAATPRAVMGAEGLAARAYFSGLAASVPPDFRFAGRVRRPPTDPVNALLSFGYTLLTNEVSGAIWRYGFDADIGCLHAPRAGRPSLALDLVEEVRPVVVDALVLALLWRRVLHVDDFVADRTTGGVRLTDDGRRRFLREYEARMLTRFLHEGTGERVTYRRALALQCAQFDRVVRDASAAYAPIRLT